MVSTYVYDVEEPFEDGGISTCRGDVLVWRAEEICHLRFHQSGRWYRWWYPSLSHTVILLKHEHRLQPRDVNCPPLIRLAQVAVAGWTSPLPQRRSAARPDLRLLK